MAFAAVAVLATLFVIPSAQARAATPPGFFGLNFYFRGPPPSIHDGHICLQ
jgi:hypothetical protein